MSDNTKLAKRLRELYSRWISGTGGPQSDYRALADELVNNAPAIIAALEAADDMHINTIADQQYDWVERMGWHNKTVLEALALIASEVGEAVNECRGEKPTDNFGTELADIILRTVDLAKWQGIDLAKVIANKMARNEANGLAGDGFDRRAGSGWKCRRGNVMDELLDAQAGVT